MTTSLLVALTILLPGVWGWLIAFAMQRLWPVRLKPDQAANTAEPRRPIDYQI